MAMEWKDYSQAKPHKPDWYLVWVAYPDEIEGYADVDYWEGDNWKFIDAPIRWWFEIEPPPSNNKQEEQ
jgi:hypothetical protein